MGPTEIIALVSLVSTVAIAVVARSGQKSDKNNDLVASIDKRVTSLEEHRQFLESLMAKIDARFDKLESKLERR